MGPVKKIKQKKGKGEGVTEAKQHKEGGIDSPAATTLHNLSIVEAKNLIVRKAATIKLLVQRIKDLETTVTGTLAGGPEALNLQNKQKFKIKNKKLGASTKINKINKKKNDKKATTPKGIEKIADVSVTSEAASKPTPTPKQKKKHNKSDVTAKLTGASDVPVEDKKNGAVRNEGTPKQKKTKKKKKNKAAVTAKPTGASNVPTATNEGTPKQKKTKKKKNKAAVTANPTGASVVLKVNKKSGAAADGGNSKQKKRKKENAKPQANVSPSVDGVDNKRKASAVIDETSIIQSVKKMKVKKDR